MKKYFLTLLLLFSGLIQAQCYSSVVSSENTIIARQTDGTLWARGQNLNGTAGNGATGFVDQFTQIGTDSNWTDAICLDSSIALALKNDGTLWAWGKYFQSTPILPIQIGTDTNWSKVAIAAMHYMAVKTDGTLWTWGSNQQGGLGTNNIDNNFIQNTPAQVGTDTNWENIYGTNTSINGVSVALKTDGTIWSWGSSSIQQLLGYPNANTNNAYRSPHQIGTDTNWATIDIGGNSITCGIKTDGTLWGWGFSGASLFGNGLPNGEFFNSLLPMQIGSDSNWATISISIGSIGALKTNGTRWGWGRNTSYQLGMGLGLNAHITVPTQVDTATDWIYVAIDSSSGFGDGIKQDHSLYHWSGLHPATLYYSPTLLGSLCTLANTNYNLNPEISVYPNPVEDIFTIHLNETSTSILNVKVFNSIGQVIIEQKNVELNTINQFNIDGSSFPSGIYLITIETNSKTYQRKIIKK